MSDAETTSATGQAGPSPAGPPPVSEIDRLAYDVIVVGAGGSGLRAAIEAREAGQKTAIISKSLFGKAHTVMAEGGCAAAMGNANPNDNWQVHYRDTMRGGKFVVFEAPAVILATGGIGKTFKVSSNSWEYTGDGHALALLAGAPLLNM
ncbi:MAG TPA: FAD-binding protein, partial [Streptosporangiaceae bacterium]